MSELLRQVEKLSACRDREALAAAMVDAVFAAVSCDAAMLFRVASAAGGPRLIPVLRRTVDGLSVITSDDDDDSDGANPHRDGVPLVSYPLLGDAYRGGSAVEARQGERVQLVWPISPGASGLASGLLVVDTQSPPDAGVRDQVGSFLGFYGNYIGLLDYSELDTLTGLNNRKTYDETFDRILAAIPCEPLPPAGVERRDICPGAKGFWLGVVDIDHFKRINDNFGHLFGDEVLLRLANLMRQTFRASDKLFRFGGEEFVVMLRPATRENAARAFERFRAAVEEHEFPQVGKVTCSIGITRIDPLLSPTDTLGHADEALYFSKENGRNQVGCYEDLVSRGLLATKEVEAPQPDFDIDALFD